MALARQPAHSSMGNYRRRSPPLRRLLISFTRNIQFLNCSLTSNGSAQNWPSIWFTFVAKVPHQGFPEWLQATDLCIHHSRLLLASFDGTPGQLDSPLQSRTVPEVFRFDAAMGLVISYFLPLLTSRHLVCCSSQTDLNLARLWIILLHSVWFKIFGSIGL